MAAFWHTTTDRSIDRVLYHHTQTCPHPYSKFSASRILGQLKKPTRLRNQCPRSRIWSSCPITPDNWYSRLLTTSTTTAPITSSSKDSQLLTVLIHSHRRPTCGYNHRSIRFILRHVEFPRSTTHQEADNRFSNEDRQILIGEPTAQPTGARATSNY